MLGAERDKQHPPMKTPLFAWSEKGYLSIWSINHFLSGYLWALIWIWASNDWLPWLNLMLFITVASLWELFENQPANQGWVWRCFGYKTGDYKGDSVMNAVTDIVVCTLGWLTVRIVAEVKRSMAALGALLGMAGALFLLFLFLNRKDLRMLRAAEAVPASDERPTINLAIPQCSVTNPLSVPPQT